jgi:uncharacterized protein (DUF2336 family)
VAKSVEYCVGVPVYDRFRELEKPHSMRKRDVVLMATVTSFESLPQPTRSDLRQFAELFRPLYENSSEESRRQAVAALTQCKLLPDAVCYFIGSLPINIAAVFLSRSKAISDQTLIDIARSQGEAHARAIATRDELAPAVVDTLTALHDGYSYRKPSVAPQPQQELAADPESVDSMVSEATPEQHVALGTIERLVALPEMKPVTIKEPETLEPDQSIYAKRRQDLREQARLAREEQLRNQLRQLVAQDAPEERPQPILKGIDPLHEALLTRFARERQVLMFSHTLAQTLGSSTWLSERVMLDISGHQLATVLVALGVNVRDIRAMLCNIYPHLAEAADGRTRAHDLVKTLDAADCVTRVAAWCRADHYTNTGRFEEEPEAANQDERAEMQENQAQYGTAPRARTKPLFGRR